MLRSFFFLIIAFSFSNLSFAQKSIPNLSLQTLDNSIIETKKITNNGLIILSFWATWCVPCLNELSNIHEVYEDWKKDTNVQLIAVSIDDNRTISRVNPMVNSNGWTYQVILDKNQDFKRALNISNIPYTLILKNGEIVFQHTGYKPGDEYILYAKLKELSK